LHQQHVFWDVIDQVDIYDICNIQGTPISK